MHALKPVVLDVNISGEAGKRSLVPALESGCELVAFSLGIAARALQFELRGATIHFVTPMWTIEVLL